MDYILKHHEWWNGEGYPLGLKGEEIPLACRILAIADAYDAMTNSRPFRDPKSSVQAFSELKRCAGTQFDPQLVEVFLEAAGNGGNNQSVRKDASGDTKASPGQPAKTNHGRS